MLTSRDAAKLTATINKAFDNIGKVNGSAMPQSNSNRDAVAYEFYIAQVLKRLSDARLDAAKEQSIAAGVIFDPKVAPLLESVTQSVFVGDVVSVGVSTKRASQSFDKVKALQGLLAALPAHKETINTIFNKCVKDNAVPHTFTASLNIGGEGA